MRPRRFAPLIAAALSIAMAIPVLGITFGQLDTNNTFANVGALINDTEVPVLDENGGVVVDENGELVTEVLPLIFCTGTLIADADGGDSNLFLTAAHCVPPDGGENGPGEPMKVTFDPTIDLGDPPFQAVLPDDSTIFAGTAFAHPDFACCGANDPFDIAVVVLDAPVAGITPAQVADAGLLDRMTKAQLRDATFIAAGYGTVRDAKQMGFKPFFFDGDRRWVEQTIMNLGKAWLNLSMQPSTGDGGTCYGDSGGPHFLVNSDGTLGPVVSLTVTGDAPCRATDRTYRVDSAVSQAFIAGFLEP